MMTKKNLPRGITGLTVFAAMAAIFLSAPLHAEVLTIFSDKGFWGVPPNVVIVYGPCAGPLNLGIGNAFNDGDSTSNPPPEGFKSWKSTDTLPVFGCMDSFEGFGLQTAVPQNLSRFQNGELRLWINSAKGDIQFQIKDSGGLITFSKLLTDFGWNAALDANQWRHYRVPFGTSLVGSKLNSVLNPILITALSTPTTFYVDHIRYVDSTAQATIFNPTIHNIIDNQQVPAGAPINWNGATLPAGWTRASQYIELDVDMTVSPWGIQIYTDNANGTGASQFTGDPTKIDPSGLVNASKQSGRLPVAWSIKALQLGDLVSPSAPQPAEPNNNGLGGRPTDPNAFQWSYMKDVQTKDIPGVGINPGSTLFQNGDPFMIVKNNLGIHFGQGNVLDTSDFGAEPTPNFIYLEANFSGASTPGTYATTRLIVELFTP